MKKEDLFEFIGNADEKKVAQAGVGMTETGSKWHVLAACLIVTLVIGALAAYAVLRPREADTRKAQNLTVNPIESLAIADLDVQFDFYGSLSEEERVQMTEDFKTYTGLAYEGFISLIPEKWEMVDLYALKAPAGGDYVVHDYVFEFQSLEGGAATIAICPSESPLRDYLIECANPKQSEINGISLTVYQYEKLYMAEFFHNGLHYDIETTNISLAEFEELLTHLVS